MLETAHLNRLRWRCRRGTQELDRLLGWFLDQRYVSADSATQDAFAALLDVQDPDLWDWLVGRSEPDDPQFRKLIEQIRAHHSV